MEQDITKMQWVELKIVDTYYLLAVLKKICTSIRALSANVYLL